MRDRYRGAWLSLVERLNGVQEVTGSSPVAPTNITRCGMNNERRRFVRIKKPIVIQYRAGSNTDKWDTTAIKDFSEGGVLFTAKHRFPENTVLNIRF